MTHAVVQKCPIFASVSVMSYFQQQTLVEFKTSWVLFEQLVHAVQPLHKYWRPVLVICVSSRVSTSLWELMSELNPLFFHQHLKSPKCPVIWIKQQLNQSTDLRSPIPAITAMHQHTSTLSNWVWRIHRCLNDRAQCLKPAWVLQVTEKFMRRIIVDLM